MSTVSELLVEMSALLLECMSSKGVTEVELTTVDNTSIKGIANGVSITVSRVWDGNDHHLSVWYKGKYSFVHADLSNLKSAIHDQYVIEQAPIREAQLQAMYKQLAEEEAARPATVDSDDDWF